jgi:hypothetical protein
MKSRILKVKQLEEASACSDRVDLFKELFGDEVKVTVSLAKKHYNKFDWDWAANYLLSVPARAEYKKVIASARAEYKKVIASAWAKLYFEEK